LTPEILMIFLNINSFTLCPEGSEFLPVRQTGIVSAPFIGCVKIENDMNYKFQFESLTPPYLPPTGGEGFSPFWGIKGGQNKVVQVASSILYKIYFHKACSGTWFSERINLRFR